MKKLFFTLVFIQLSFAGFSQQQSTYNHFYTNSFMYNPAFAGAEDYGSITAVSRMQWAGSDRAVSSAFVTAELPVKRNIAIGGRFYSDKQGLINNNSGLITVAYHLTLNPKSKLSFGLSAGASRRSINTDKLNASSTDDPVIGNADNNRGGFDGDFGLNYNYDGLNLGLALPALFRTYNAGLAGSSGQQYLLSAAYKINNNFAAIEPKVIYRNKNEFGGKTETMLTLYFKQNFWAGGLYRFGYGPAFYGGFKAGKNFKVGYAYETSPNGQSAPINGTHEIFLSFQFVKKGTN